MSPGVYTPIAPGLTIFTPEPAPVSIYSAIAALEYEAYVAHEYVHRVEIPEHVEERGRFAEHEHIASSFRPALRKPNILIGAAVLNPVHCF